MHCFSIQTRLQTSEQIKKELLQRLRDLMLSFEQTMKAVTVSYWQLMHTITAAEPVQYQQLADKTKQYECGSQYAEFVGSLRDLPSAIIGPFAFISSDGDQPIITTGSSSSAAINRSMTTSSSAIRFGGNRAIKTASDSESGESAGEESNPTAQITVTGNGSSGEELDDLNYCALNEPSSAAASHQFRQLRTPSRCRECDNICFQGFECVSVCKSSRFLKRFAFSNKLRFWSQIFQFSVDFACTKSVPTCAQFVAVIVRWLVE